MKQIIIFRKSTLQTNYKNKQLIGISLDKNFFNLTFIITRWYEKPHMYINISLYNSKHVNYRLSETWCSLSCLIGILTRIGNNTRLLGLKKYLKLTFTNIKEYSYFLEYLMCKIPNVCIFNYHFVIFCSNSLTRK